MLINVIGGILAAVALATTYFSLKFRNILLNLGAAAAWATLLDFFLLNTTPGTNWQTMFIWTVACFVIALALLSMFNRNGESVVKGFTGVSARENDKETKETKPRGMMDLTPEEYRAYVRSRVRQGRSRR